MRILHIAPFNTSGVPLIFVHAERSLGYDSRLITLAKNRQSREEDICLNLPFIDFWGVRCVKKMVVPKKRRIIKNIAVAPKKIPLQWGFANSTERFLINFREYIWTRTIDNVIRDYDLWNVDVIQLDGGLGFYRNGRFIRALKERGKKVICCYTGSDLRIRGTIPEIDRISDLNITVEFDHLRFHPDIHHVPFPLNLSSFNLRKWDNMEIIRIGHAPTNRKAKGSDVIIRFIKEMEQKFSVKLVLIENLKFEKAIELKRSCHLFIDQIGNLGYGMNAIEALAMGIPACSSLAPGFKDTYPDHPFIEITGENIKEVMIDIIKNYEFLEEIGRKGWKWVQNNHDALQVIKEIHRLADIKRDII
jgi:glycosyltransferase involved in cell wall biosynthesis